MILYFILILIFIIIIWIALLNVKENNIKKILEEIGFTNYNNNSEISELNKCQVPSLNTEQCYKSRYFECPIVNGSYLQCTNNYIPKPNTYNADCGNRTFEMVPYPWKISEDCYYNKINFNREKEFGKVKFT
jgi:hypothetical protein